MVDVDKRASVIEEEEKRAESRRLRSVKAGAALALLALVLALPALYRPTLYGKLPFDGHIADEIAAVRPKYVFVGNSMLGTRIDPATLEANLGKHCCYVLWTGGAESAWDHQALKNEVLSGTHRPRTVFVFFRDAYLTRVTYRANDMYWWKIERLSHADEPELERAMRESRTWQERLEHTLGLVYPIQKRRDRADYALEWLAAQAVAPGRVHTGEAPAGKYNELFGLDRLRGSEAADDAGGGPDDHAIYDFDARLPKSLLPSMIRLARQAGVELVFVRVQRRPTPHGPPQQPPELVRYVAKLKDYLAASGAGFYDFTGDPELTLDRYLDGDHIAASWKPQSTELFLHRLDAYFR